MFHRCTAGMKHRTVPVFVDSHAHLDMEAYGADLDAVLARARAAGLTHIVCIGGAPHEVRALRGDPTSSGMTGNPAAVRLAEQHPQLFAAVGLHPHDAAGVTDAMWPALRQLAAHPRTVAVGETGLDYHYEHAPRDAQRALFARFIGLACELRKPVVVHAREADEDVLALLRSEGAARCGGVLHSFTGSEALARGALELGFHVSFSGILTFKNAEPLRALAATLPQERVLVETDCPFLAPVPLRGQRNEPAFVTHTADALARLWGVPPETARRVTGANAARLFRFA